MSWVQTTVESVCRGLAVVVTFQVQIDPLKFHGNTWEPDTSVVFTKEQLAGMRQDLENFYSDLQKYNHYSRSEMYVDGEVYRP